MEVTQFRNQAFAVFVRDHELTVDQPVEAGGDNEGPTPVELFVVVGRRAGSGSAGITQTLLRDAGCPVAVVPW